MLLFIDAPKFVRVVRVSEGDKGSGRVRLGVILKPALRPRIDDSVTLSSDETAEIEAAIAHMKSAEGARLKYEAMKFPEIARNVSEYYAEGATELEKRMISIALLEATRAVRKADKGDSPELDPAAAGSDAS